MTTSTLSTAEQTTFREGMSKVFAAVHVVTIRDDKETLGTTATAVCSVSDSPPTLLVCLHKQGKAHNAISPGVALTVNTLAADQEAIAQAFAGVGGLSMAERFATGDWDTNGDAAPSLRTGVACFQTRVHELIDAGSHSIIICRIQNIEMSETPAALLYGARQYHALPTHRAAELSMHTP